MTEYEEFRETFTKALNSIFIKFSKNFLDSLFDNIVENIIAVYDGRPENEKYNMGFLSGIRHHGPEEITLDLFYFNGVQKFGSSFIDDERIVFHSAFGPDVNMENHQKEALSYYSIDKYFSNEDEPGQPEAITKLNRLALTMMSNFVFTFYFRNRNYDVVFTAKIKEINKSRKSKFDHMVKMTYSRGFINMLIENHVGKENQNATQ